MTENSKANRDQKLDQIYSALRNFILDLYEYQMKNATSMIENSEANRDQKLDYIYSVLRNFIIDLYEYQIKNTTSIIDQIYRSQRIQKQIGIRNWIGYIHIDSRILDFILSLFIVYHTQRSNHQIAMTYECYLGALPKQTYQASG